MRVFICTILSLILSLVSLAQKPKYKITIEAPDTVAYGDFFSVKYTLTLTGSWTGSSWYNMRTYRKKPGDNVLPEYVFEVRGKKYVAPERHIFVKVNPSYEKELLAARAFLATKGVDMDSCELDMKFKNEYVTCFCDFRYRRSILLANAKYHSLMDTPVLFWSMESCRSDFNTDESTQKLLKYYCSQLDDIEKDPSLAMGVNDKNQIYVPQQDVVKPLLGGICFDQGDPYNLQCPTINGKSCLVGCVPIACAQVMAHYKYPTQGIGFHSYLTADKTTVVSKDFTKVKMNWEKYGRDNYREKGCDSLSMMYISTLLTAVSGSLSADFKKESTSASHRNIESALVNFWGYDPGCMMCNTNNVDTVVGLIRRELDEGRIALVSDRGHMFLADGCENNFLHYNFGWGGSWNGYYRTSILKKVSQPFHISTLVIGVKPKETEDLSLTINLSKPNTLRTTLSEEQQKKVTSLTISGSLGNDDVLLLRQMLGADNPDNLFMWTGVLSELDLTKAKFKTDKKTTYRMERAHGNAGKSWTTVSTVTRWDDGDEMFSDKRNTDYHYYNFDKMSKSDWNKFKTAGLNIRDGEEILYDNGVCWRKYHVESGIISPLMFYNCQNLRKIRLPKNTEKICYTAFAGCTSLTDILLESKVKEIEDYAFSSTILLKTIQAVSPGTIKATSKVCKDGYYNVSFKRVVKEK